MRDKTGCPGDYMGICYGDVEPDSKRCSYDRCPLQVNLKLAYTIAENSPPVQERATLSVWYIARAIVATWFRALADWIAP